MTTWALKGMLRDLQADAAYVSKHLSSIHVWVRTNEVQLCQLISEMVFERHNDNVFNNINSGGKLVPAPI